VIAAGNGEGKGKYLVKTCKWWYFYNYEAIGTLAGFFKKKLSNNNIYYIFVILIENRLFSH
jgi:hypothetical protein